MRATITQMRSPLPLFAAAAALPLPLIGAAALWGGYWAGIAVLCMTLLAFVLDEAVARTLPALPDAEEFPVADGLSALLAAGHLGILFLSVAALSGDALEPLEKALLFAATGLCLGQIGNANAHELIHRSGRGLRGLGIAVYTALMFGHHASAHPLVHHVHVATPRDPNSARPGESYWRFLPRAWIGSFRAGLKAETARRRRAGKPAWRHPYVLYIGGALAALGLSALIGGWGGIAAHLTLASFATSQLMLSDYVQHYGLVRATGPDGKPEPVGPQHSWNAPHAFSSAMLLNAPRHSDHHAHPRRSYPALTLPERGPMLPRSLPVMACIALWPGAWRRLMDHRAARWRDGPARRLAAE